MDEEHGIGVGICQQRCERCDVALGRRITDDVDRVGARPAGRQHRVELRERLRRERRQLSAALDQRIGRHYRRSTAVTDDRQAWTDITAAL